MRILVKIYTGNFSLYVHNFGGENEKRSYSQFGQDLFVFEKLFGRKKSGFFVDVGGHHPVEGNNTYLFEQNGWEGIAIEPQEKFRNMWVANRRADCLNCVIGDENKEVSFVEGGAEDGFSGVEGFNKVSKDYKKITCEQKKLADVLGGRKDVDYLSIDVEGYEMNVLKGIDFTGINIKVIELENDLGLKWLPFIGKQLAKELGDNAIRIFLKKKGYKHVARIYCDDFFVKQNEREML